MLLLLTPVAYFKLGDSESLGMTEMRDMVSSHSKTPSALEFDAPEHIIPTDRSSTPRSSCIYRVRVWEQVWVGVGVDVGVGMGMGMADHSRIIHEFAKS